MINIIIIIKLNLIFVLLKLIKQRNELPSIDGFEYSSSHNLLYCELYWGI
jgi:hypothetical protein